jgi:hypothetical protein
MRFAVVLRIDPAGQTAFISREDSEPLESEEGVRYRLLGETDDYGEAVRLADQANAREGDNRRERDRPCLDSNRGLGAPSS